MVSFHRHHLTPPSAIAVLRSACLLLDALPPPPLSGPRRLLLDRRWVHTACPLLLHAASTTVRSMPSPSQPPPHRQLLDDSSISRASPLSPSIGHLSLRKLIQVLSICRLGTDVVLSIYRLETDSIIVHLSLRKLIQVLFICRLQTGSSIFHLSFGN
jgi:hypothetical protein